jgi:diguanylate cyclase (GGDEF)-like protein
MIAAAAILELAVVASSLATGASGFIVALRMRASARAGRLALRLAHEREAAFVEASRRLADAARTSVAAVRDELARAARVVVPAVDGVLIYEHHDDALTCVFADGSRLSYYAGTRIALDDARALPVRALQRGHRVTLADEDVRPIHPGDVAAVGMPLAANRCALVVCAQHALDRAAVDRLATLADQASPAYEIARERESDRRRAEYDALTGLLTPRAFRQRLAAFIDRARFAPHERLALLFVDTDHFKEWNDTYGHATGDALLREVAQVLRNAARCERDLVARNGGDEFCLVFTETSKAAAIERAETLRAQIAALDVVALRPPAAPPVRITASIGVAAFPSDASQAGDLLERADAAMYHSKHTGRDAVSYLGVDGSNIRLNEAVLSFHSPRSGSTA